MDSPTETTRIVVATRKSALALAQCRALMRELEAAQPGLRVEELGITTKGDQILDRSLSEIGGKGLFIKEIEEALLDGRADIAVHSLKDVPPELEATLCLGCFPKREDPRDAVVTNNAEPLLSLPRAARVGTSSLRRKVQLLALRPDLEVLPLRGNVDTRLRKCKEGEVDAILLALSGLRRLGRAMEATELLDPAQCLPAVGQGALVVEHRNDDARIRALLAPLHDPVTAISVLAERGVMEAVEGSCQMPVAAYAERRGEQMLLRALLAEPDGSNLRKEQVVTAWPQSGEEASEHGRALGRRLKG